MNINELSQEEFDALSFEEVQERANKLDAEQSDDSSDVDTDDQESDDVDEQETEELDDPESEEDDDSPEETTEDDVDPETEVEDNQTQVTKEVPTKTKAPKKDKQETVSTEVTLDPKEFQNQITAAFKAAGKEYSFSDPKDIISLMQKGVAFTQKAQSLSHLKGLNELLTQNGLTDPTELAFLIDVKKGKPEAIAKLIQEHKIDTYDLDEDKASTYKSSTVDIDAHAQLASLNELIADNVSDPNFNTVLNEARKWDDVSQEHLYKNQDVLEVLRDQKASGEYDTIFAEMNRRNVVNPSKLPIMQQYVQIGTELFGNSGSAQNTQVSRQVTPVAKERVIVKRNVDEQRKRVAPNKGGGSKPSTVKVRTVADINSLSDEDFKNLNLNELLKMK